MRLYFVTAAGLGLVLIVGICIAGVVTGGGVPEGGAPFTVTIVEGICSFCGRDAGTESTGPGPESSGAAGKHLIFHENISFSWSDRSFETDVGEGPLVISYIIRAYDRTTFDSFMRVTVTDSATGRVLLEDGFRRQYDGDTEKVLNVFPEGPVRIDVCGNRVNADISVYSGR